MPVIHSSFVRRHGIRGHESQALVSVIVYPSPEGLERGRGGKGLAGKEACFGEEVEHAGDKEMGAQWLRARA